MGKKVVMLGRCEDFSGGIAAEQIRKLEAQSSIFSEEHELLNFLRSI